MTRPSLWLALLASLVLLVGPRVALADVPVQATVLSACGTMNYPVGQVRTLTQTQTALLCLAPNGGSTATAPVSLQQTTTASAVQLGANPLTNGAIFEIPSTDTGTVCVGTVGVTTSTGYCMSVASGITAGSLGVNNTNLIYVIGTNTSDKLFVLGN